MANAQEKFLVVYLTRANIAEMFNEHIQEHQLDVFLFHGDSDRLTQEICQEVADGWAEILDDDISEEDRGAEQRELTETILRKHFC